VELQGARKQDSKGHRNSIKKLVAMPGVGGNPAQKRTYAGTDETIAARGKGNLCIGSHDDDGRNRRPVGVRQTQDTAQPEAENGGQGGLESVGRPAAEVELMPPA
jgi:hypothetical protein